MSENTLQEPAKGATEPERRRLSIVVERVGQWWTVGVLIGLVILFGALEPRFLSREGWLATSEYAVEFLLIGIGQTFVIVTGGIDLSVGAIVGTSGIAGGLVMAYLVDSGAPGELSVLLGLITCLLTGLAVGLLNGLLITRLSLAPFIVTLGTLTAFGGGVVFLLNNGSPISRIPLEISPIGQAVLARWIPVPVLIALVAAIAMGTVLARTRFGMRTYIIGSDQTTARRAGINVEKHLLKIYMISGVLAAIAGFVIVARFNNASPIAGKGTELYAIASVVIGGASLFGGRGTILGTVVGAFTIAVLTTGLVILGIQPFWQPVAIGFVVIAAVAIDQARTRLVGD